MDIKVRKQYYHGKMWYVITFGDGETWVFPAQRERGGYGSAFCSDYRNVVRKYRVA